MPINGGTAPKGKTGNLIGDKGACALSEALKVNTKLSTLKLKSEPKSQGRTEQACAINNKDKAGNGIKEAGVCALSEALKINTTVTALDLEGEQQQIEANQRR